MNKLPKYVGLLFGLFVVYVVGTLTITLTMDEVLYRRTLERCMQDSAFLRAAEEFSAFLESLTPEQRCRRDRRRSHYEAQ